VHKHFSLHNFVHLCPQSISLSHFSEQFNAGCSPGWHIFLQGWVQFWNRFSHRLWHFPCLALSQSSGLHISIIWPYYRHLTLIEFYKQFFCLAKFMTFYQSDPVSEFSYIKSKFPNTYKPCLALDKATFILFSIFIYPNYLFRLFLTKDRMTISFSSP
jgi:hypothetical protein